MSDPILLKALLQDRHWQTYRTFCHEYDKAAREIDPQLVGSWPSRAQLHRWLSGGLKGLPYPDHCRVLEAMFPGHTVHQMFDLAGASLAELPDVPRVADIFQAVTQGLNQPADSDVEWGARHTASTGGSGVTADAARMALPSTDVAPTSREFGQKLLELQKVMRLSGEETNLLAGLAGNVVEMSMSHSAQRFDCGV